MAFLQHTRQKNHATQGMFAAAFEDDRLQRAAIGELHERRISPQRRIGRVDNDASNGAAVLLTKWLGIQQRGI